MLIGLGQAFAVALVGAFMRIPQMDTPMNRMLADRPTAIVIALLGVTIAPLAEELAFRGLLQPLLIRSVGVVPGILITSIVFGAMHLEQYGAWQSVVLISLAGVGFGAMRHWTGSTRASALMHAGYNSALFILFFSQKGAR
jgi:membrane protease YdiL (CAAX protease family)